MDAVPVIAQVARLLERIDDRLAPPLPLAPDQLLDDTGAQCLQGNAPFFYYLDQFVAVDGADRLADLTFLEAKDALAQVGHGITWAEKTTEVAAFLGVVSQGTLAC